MYLQIENNQTTHVEFSLSGSIFNGNVRIIFISPPPTASGWQMAEQAGVLELGRFNSSIMFVNKSAIAIQDDCGSSKAN